MPKLTHTHLHRIIVDGVQLPIVVNARSQAAVREHFVEHYLRIERMTPEEAFKAGVGGATIETASRGPVAQPAHDSDHVSPPEQGTMPVDPADAATRPMPSDGSGYASAMHEAATL